MDPHSLRLLELEAALDILAGQCTCPLGQRHIRSRRPLDSMEAIQAAQSLVREAIQALEDGDALAFGGLVDVHDEVVGAGKGVVLDGRSLTSIGAALSASREARTVLLDRAARAPALAGQAERLVDLAPLERRIQKSIGPDAEVLDTASSELEKLRHRLRELSGRIQGKMASFLRDSQYSKMLQEALFSRRDDRYVLPIKAEYRGSFPGLVLDASASGATVFMEPLAVVELDNERRRVQAEEKHEVDKVLRELSALVGQRDEDILYALEAIAHLDGVFAAARYSLSADAGLPDINDQGRIRLLKARHPLLRGTVVPIDIEVGRDFHTLVITGPNTGGKTVTLKTLGLLTILAMCGFPIPASSGSEVSIMQDVFADIGDEQAIVQNLSTFSSHISKIVQFLSQSGPRTLLLMDELGTGTDPREGTGLAMAILEYLHQRGVRTVITTHYSELKSFAGTCEGAMNASVEFDEETLRPTYRVLIGLPGRSCALVIAERLGVPSEVIRRAREWMGDVHFDMENLVEELEQQRSDAEKNSEDLNLRLARVQHMEKQYEERLRDLRAREGAVLEQAVQAAESVVESAREELKAAVRETRHRLSGLKAEGQGGADKDVLQAAEQATKSAIDLVVERLQATRDLAGVQAAPRHDFRIGDRVRVKRLHQTGVVSGPMRGGLVQLMVGNVKMSLSGGELEFLGKGPAPVKPTMTVEGPRSPVRTASLRLDLRGMRAEEAVFEVERFIDQAARSNSPSLAIIHGKGQGILRKSVQEYLRDCPCVQTYRIGDDHEGGSGVTVVMLK